MNIEGLGPKILDALMDNGLIQDSADIYDLKEGDSGTTRKIWRKVRQKFGKCD